MKPNARQLRALCVKCGRAAVYVAFVALLGQGVLSAQPAAAGGTAAAPGAKRMNVLFIMSDDMRAEPETFNGKAITPNIDGLAARGVKFNRAYCQYPLCCPSRSSMLTGKYPTTTNVYSNRQWVLAEHPDWITLPEYFKDEGYVTLRAGKIFHGGIDNWEAWTEGGQRRIFGDDTPQTGAPGGDGDTLDPDEAGAGGGARGRRGGARRGGAATSETQALGARRGGPRVVRRGDGGPGATNPGSDHWAALADPADDAGDSRTTERTLAFLKKYGKGDKPFFMAFGLVKPHSPLEAPERFFNEYDLSKIQLTPDYAPRPTVPDGFPAGSIRPRNADLFIGRDSTPETAKEMALAYYACCSYVDWNVGRVLAELKELGIEDNTIVVFQGDHGYQLGEKGKWSKAGSLWEEGTRIPFIIYDPRAKGNGTACDRVVQGLDNYPTLVDLCGLPPRNDLEGRSLKPLLDDPKAEWDHVAYSVWNERGQGLTGAVVRDENWRYAEFYGRGPGKMLIDPKTDPYEMHNLADDPKYADVVARLAPLLHKFVEGKTDSGAPVAAPAGGAPVAAGAAAK